MKSFLITLGLCCCALPYYSQVVDIPDANFLNKIIESNVDRNNDGLIQISEAESITFLSVSARNIVSMEGIQAFKNLTYLECNWNDIEQLDVSNLKKLEQLHCSGNEITELIYHHDGDALEIFDCSDNKLNEIKYGTNLSQKELNIGGNSIEVVDLEGYPNLEVFKCYNNSPLREISFTYNIAIKEIGINQSQIEQVDFSNNTYLENLYLSGNDIDNIDLSNNKLLESLSITNTGVNNLNLSNNVVLQSLRVDNNENLVQLNLSSNVNLEYLSCDSNKLDKLDLHNNIKLQLLSCSDNNLSKLDISPLINLWTVDCSMNRINELNLTRFGRLRILNCSNNLIDNLNVDQLNGLRELDCSSNLLNELNVEHNTNLTEIDCSDNNLLELNVEKNILLISINCSYNQLKELNLSRLNTLASINCEFNRITNLTLPYSENLSYLYCQNNEIRNLDLISAPNLGRLNCSYNELSNLFISENKSLSLLESTNNNLRTFNIETLIWPLVINLDSNDLVALYLKNNNYDIRTSLGQSNNLSIAGNDNLRYICASESEISDIQEIIDFNGQNPEVNSDCTYNYILSNGVNTVSGEIKIGNSDTDCNISLQHEVPYEIKIDSAIYTLGTSENYSVHLPNGEFELEFNLLGNEAYYEIMPSSFSAKLSPKKPLHTQDICIKKLVDIDKLEVSLLPLDNLRPGFKVRYKLIYKNTGTTVLNGHVDFRYENDYMKYISSSTEPTIQLSDVLRWSFSDLKPFESRECIIELEANRPTDQPPLQGGEVLLFKAPYQYNSFKNPEEATCLSQTVVNSFDPNDKTCLEGDRITESMIGEYVHYKIRFENLGTASAVNVRVSDRIDLNTFDIKTLQIVDSSHDMYTILSDNNHVEFMFQDIYLPFQDDINDGYVVFKIKTLPSLKLGDILQNTAEIFFDFNPAIVTNTAETIVKNPEPERKRIIFNYEVYLYPNPTDSKVEIIANDIVTKVKLTDLTGRLIHHHIFENPNKTLSIDVTDIPEGMYLLTSFTERDSDTQKIYIK
jgi:uncharacterized repeat protein (TIGR01451 family)